MLIFSFLFKYFNDMVVEFKEEIVLVLPLTMMSFMKTCQ